MSLRTACEEVMEAAEHLPQGATLVVHDLSWEDYDHLLEGWDGNLRLRVSYDCGRLEVVSTSNKHEAYSVIIDNLIVAYCDALDLTLQGYRRTTWKRKPLAKGAEADECYYLENANRVLEDRDLDLESDPPPDIVLEIDLTRDSHRKLAIYAAFSIPEVWRYDGRDIQFWQLRDREYVEVAGSRLLPGLSRELLAESIEISKTAGQTAARKHLRSRIQRSSS